MNKKTNAMNKLLLGAFLASIFLSLTACSEENPEQDTNPPAEQPGDSTDPGDSGDDPLPEYPAPDRSTIAAFPGAEGAGKLTTGGAGGDSVHSNLSQRRWFRRDSSLGDREIG